MPNTITALNTASGLVAIVPASYLKHPILSKHLVEVPAGTKSFNSAKFKPVTAKEYLASRAKPKAEEPKEPASEAKPAPEKKI